MKLEKFSRHKATHGYMAAKYPAILMNIALAILIFIPGITYLAWLLAFIFLYREKDSDFLRLHQSQNVFLLLILSILRLALSTTGDFLIRRAVRFQSQNLYMQSLIWNKRLDLLGLSLQIIVLIILIVQAFMAYSYIFLKLPGLGTLAHKLEEATRPGPLR